MPKPTVLAARGAGLLLLLCLALLKGFGLTRVARPFSLGLRIIIISAIPKT